jgi:acyl dehydratase
MATATRAVTISDGATHTRQAENLFADMEYLRSQGHPARMAPGMLTASIADALIVGSGIIEGYAVAMIGIDGLMAKKGVYAGDTISVEFEVRTPFRQAALPAG